MEDQKKTDVIKNMRTVLPPLNLKASEVPEQSVQKSVSSQSSPPQSKQNRIAPVAEPSHAPNIMPNGMMMYGYRHPDRERPLDKLDRPDRPHMHMPPAPGGRYRVHPSNGYTPYNPFGKAPLGYPPGRQPPHAQTRYYPPSRQHPYMGEMHSSGRMPSDKKPPMAHPQRHTMPPSAHGPAHPPSNAGMPGPSNPAILMPEVGGSAKIQIKDAMRYLDVVKEEYKNNKEVYNKFLKTMKDYKDRHINAKTVIEIMLSIFNGNQKLIQGFNQFLPKKYEILPSGEVKMHGERPDTDKQPKRMPPREYPPASKPPQMQYDPRRDLEGLGIGIKSQPARTDQDNMGRVVNYLNKVRKHLENNPVSWFEFLRIVQSYKNSKEHRPIPEILASIKVLLKDDPVLISEFMVFLPQQEKKSMRPGQRQLLPPPADSLSMLNDIRTLLSRRGIYKEFVKALNMFNQGLLNTNALLLIVEPFLRGSASLLSLFRYYIGHREVNVPPHIQSNLETYKKVGSYRVLPEKYRQSMHTGQTPDDAAVLNTGYVACPTFSSESSTFIFAKKNAHEEALFRVEDERYECDVLLERVSSFILKLMEYEAIVIADANVSKEHNKCPLPVLKLSALDKEIIGAVYGASCDDIILGIISHPIRAIPVVLKQLRSVEAQWIKARTVSLEIWRSTVDRNYIKSLDVRGYKIRSTERKTTLLKQFTKELDVSKEVSFSLGTRSVCEQILSIISDSMDLEAGAEKTRALETFMSLPLQCSVFLGTPEIYCALKGISTICCRVAEAIHGKRIKPGQNKVAEDLGIQRASTSDNTQEGAESLQEMILSSLRAYVMEEIDAAEFEEKMIQGLGVPGASLVGILGVFQNVESMIDTALENKASLEMLERVQNREHVQTSNLSELMIRGVPIVCMEISTGLDNTRTVHASRVPHTQAGPAWISYVKKYSTEETEDRQPFMKRSLCSKRKTQASFGLEPFFAQDRLKVCYIPGTEDFMSVKRRKTEEIQE
ncbi:hypothetical protein NERG_00607 [Nematocida ausubeli]|uniref:Histone deacetylase interacting domain-containing protein n=1 Tax=Nematocida ausubeli (strain ATCC PRA-371 / ERTm2) TaxID=1913371 RepID=H8ZAK8_NEMA1|nr:hypothetical protein NERG_00607 [Nematocida ausubeli]